MSDVGLFWGFAITMTMIVGLGIVYSVLGWDPFPFKFRWPMVRLPRLVRSFFFKKSDDPLQSRSNWGVGA